MLNANANANATANICGNLMLMLVLTLILIYVNSCDNVYANTDAYENLMLILVAKINLKPMLRRMLMLLLMRI